MKDTENSAMFMLVIACVVALVIIVCVPIMTDAVTRDDIETCTYPTEITAPPETVINKPKPIRVPEPICEPLEAAVPEETEPEVDQEALEMLACVAYKEAGSNRICDDCRRRVIDVVLNRVEDDRFPDTIYEVLTQKGQYNTFYWTGIVWPDRASHPSEAEAVERAYRIAEEVLLGQHSELYGEGYIWQSTEKLGRGAVFCCGHYYCK